MKSRPHEKLTFFLCALKEIYCSGNTSKKHAVVSLFCIGCQKRSFYFAVKVHFASRLKKNMKSLSDRGRMSSEWLGIKILLIIPLKAYLMKTSLCRIPMWKKWQHLLLLMYWNVHGFVKILRLKNSFCNTFSSKTKHLDVLLNREKTSIILQFTLTTVFGPC